MQKYRYKGRIYSIENCVMQDIPSHLERVLSYYRPDEIETQRQRMVEAVYCGTAYKLVNPEGETVVFAYYEQMSEEEAKGIALWWESIRLFSIFGIWFRSYTFNQFVYIKPHKKDFVTFEFLVEDYSIRNYHLHDSPLIIDLFSDKCRKIIKLYERLEVKEI